LPAKISWPSPRLIPADAPHPVELNVRGQGQQAGSAAVLDTTYGSRFAPKSGNQNQQAIPSPYASQNHTQQIERIGESQNQQAGSNAVNGTIYQSPFELSDDHQDQQAPYFPYTNGSNYPLDEARRILEVQRIQVKQTPLASEHPSGEREGVGGNMANGEGFSVSGTVVWGAHEDNVDRVDPARTGYFGDGEGDIGYPHGTCIVS
jgi:hypothetical protein